MKNSLRTTTLFRICVCFSLLSFSVYFPVFSQNGASVTSIITNFGSSSSTPAYWMSGSISGSNNIATNLNSTTPNLRHDLLGFVWNGTRYTTSVNDDLVATAMGGSLSGWSQESFKAWSPVDIPLYTLNYNSTYVLFAPMEDGSSSSPALIPSWTTTMPTLSFLMTTSSPYDPGNRGLDLSTGFSNISSATAADFYFYLASSNGITAASVNDGVPDLLFPNIAMPTGTNVTMTFCNASGTAVSNTVTINFVNITTVSNNSSDFFSINASNSLVANSTNNARTIKIWAADLSDFFSGSYATTYTQAVYLKIHNTGSNDPAFLAYNTNSITPGSPTTLPVSFAGFNAVKNGTTALLEWKTSSELNNSGFYIQRSSDSKSWNNIGFVPSQAQNGNSSVLLTYTFSDASPVSGMNYYRLMQVDKDQSSKYSSQVYVNFGAGNDIVLYPNPVVNTLTVSNVPVGGQLRVVGLDGKIYFSRFINTSIQEMNVHSLSKGVYLVEIFDANAQSLSKQKFIKQ